MRKNPEGSPEIRKKNRILVSGHKSCDFMFYQIGNSRGKQTPVNYHSLSETACFVSRRQHKRSRRSPAVPSSATCPRRYFSSVRPVTSRQWRDILSAPLFSAFQRVRSSFQMFFFLSSDSSHPTRRPPARAREAISSSWLSSRR